jgi:tripartite-type tricarboxylate transporter receptor subunit TctC
VTSFTRRGFLQFAAAPVVAPAVFASRSEVAAQTNYPSRPIEIVIPLPPGGPTDTAPRIFIEHLRPLLKATFVPVNKPGAGGAIAAEYVHRSSPDGHTILATSNPTLSVKAALDKKLPYRLEDFAALGMYATDVGIFAARRDLDIKTVEDLIARARRSPDELSYASAGQGTVTHISAEIFKSVADIKLLHVPHRGSGPATQAVLGGHVPLISSSYSAAAPLIEGGQIVPLITTAAKRLPDLPDVPTMAEKGLGDVALNIWMGFFVSAQTPTPILDLLTRAISKVAYDPAVTALLTRARMSPEYGDPASAAALLEHERQLVSRLAEKVQLGE